MCSFPHFCSRRNAANRHVPLGHAPGHDDGSQRRQQPGGGGMSSSRTGLPSFLGGKAESRPTRHALAGGPLRVGRVRAQLGLRAQEVQPHLMRLRTRSVKKKKVLKKLMATVSFENKNWQVPLQGSVRPPTGASRCSCPAAGSRGRRRRRQRRPPRRPRRRRRPRRQGGRQHRRHQRRPKSLQGHHNHF